MLRVNCYRQIIIVIWPFTRLKFNNPAIGDKARGVVSEWNVSDFYNNDNDNIILHTRIESLML